MSKPTVEQLRRECVGVDEQLITQHIERLDGSYYELFDMANVRRHLEALAGLTREHPVEVLVDELAGGTIGVTVLAVDYPGLFSLISGVFTASGFTIRQGHVYTYGRIPKSAVRHRRRPRPLGRKPREDLTKRRRIIDHFIGMVEDPIETDAWIKQVRAHLDKAVKRLAEGDADAAKRRINELVTAKLINAPGTQQAVLTQTQLEIEEQPSNEDGATAVTRIKVAGQDSPAFLYTLTNALSMHDLSIEAVRIHTRGEWIEDVIDVVDKRGEPVRDKNLLEKITLSVLLTKQFTYFLGSSPDPFTALGRFENLSRDIIGSEKADRWLDLLSNPLAMEDLAKLLGASEHLWQDFIRLEYEQLLTLLRPKPTGRRIAPDLDTLGQRHDQAIEAAPDYPAKVDALNRVKDDTIFKFELDDILTPGSSFRDLSRRLTALAETVVQRAGDLAWDHLAGEHGAPCDEQGNTAHWACFGLGKFGGVALGYASDIELLFVYDKLGRTNGERPIDNAEFFTHWVNAIIQIIRAKREGIFEIDLRLRPFGKDGPVASSVQAFTEYFTEDGPAHAMERLALTRLRAVAGDAELGRTVERLRDQCLYESTAPNRADLTELRAKAYAEKARGRTFNTKFGCGGLNDLESSVQMLQAEHGRELQALRTTSIHQALTALADGKKIDRFWCRAVTQAYDFYRKLINGIRMLRGNAADLFMPSDPDELIHLARRIGYHGHEGREADRQLDGDLMVWSAVVRGFVARYIEPSYLPDAEAVNPVDLLFRQDLPDSVRGMALETFAAANPEKVDERLRRLAGGGDRVRWFAALVPQIIDDLHGEEHSGLALKRWAKLVEVLPDPTEHFRMLGRNPSRLRVLIKLLARSEKLGRLLLRVPGLIDWSGRPEAMIDPRHIEQIERALGDVS